MENNNQETIKNNPFEKLLNSLPIPFDNLELTKPAPCCLNMVDVDLSLIEDEADSLDEGYEVQIAQINKAIDIINSIDFNAFKFFAAEKIEVDGENMFDLLCKIRNSISRLEVIEKDIKSYMLTELEKHPKNTFVGFNHRFSLAETGVVYEYKVSEEWNKVNEIKKELESKLKKHVPKRSTTAVKVEYIKF